MATDTPILQLCEQVEKLAKLLRSRINVEDGKERILGWSGFHQDLDALDEATDLLRARARGLG